MRFSVITGFLAASMSTLAIAAAVQADLQAPDTFSVELQVGGSNEGFLITPASRPAEEGTLEKRSAGCYACQW